MNWELIAWIFAGVSVVLSVFAITVLVWLVTETRKRS